MHFDSLTEKSTATVTVRRAAALEIVLDAWLTLEEGPVEVNFCVGQQFVRGLAVWPGVSLNWRCWRTLLFWLFVATCFLYIKFVKIRKIQNRLGSRFWHWRSRQDSNKKKSLRSTTRRKVGTRALGCDWQSVWRSFERMIFVTSELINVCCWQVIHH